MRNAAYAVLGVIVVLMFFFLPREHAVTPRGELTASMTYEDSLLLERQIAQMKVETHCVQVITHFVRSEMAVLRLYSSNDTSHSREMKEALDETSRIVTGTCMQYLKPLAEQDERLKRSLESAIYYRKHGVIMGLPRTRKSGASFLP